MRRVAAGVLALAGCRDPIVSAPTPPATAAPPPAAPRAPDVVDAAVCDRTLPRAACARAPVARCAADDPRRVGEWRYAVIAPLLTAHQDVTRDQLVAAWQAGTLAATAETRAALAPILGPGAPTTLAAGARPDLDATRWAIVPADELVPQWQVITVDGHHPLDPDPGAALAIPLCAAPPRGSGPRPPEVRNIDPALVTTIIMTGTTALTRRTARLLDRAGTAYPARDVEPWLRSADFVHISNEVSMNPSCDPDRSPHMAFCSRDRYIELLEASHARIIELTGSHLHDFGRRWIEHTLELYAARGWVWFGGGRDQLEATAPLIIDHHGNRIGLVGCNTVYTETVITEGPGPAACDLGRIAWQVGDLRRRGIVPIVSLQHEEVYRHDPPDVIVRDFRRLGEAGAALVFGSQAHTAHPWEVHHGAFLHYGAGNFYFDQEFGHTAEGAQDKLYIHANRLMTVGRLLTKVEDEGRPRPMTERERARFLAEMRACLARLGKADPWAAPQPLEAHPRLDAFLIGKAVQGVAVTEPAIVLGFVRYPLVIELDGAPRPPNSDPTAFVVRPRRPDARRSERWAGAAIEFMRAKYPIDPERVSIRARLPRGPSSAPAGSTRTRPSGSTRTP